MYNLQAYKLKMEGTTSIYYFIKEGRGEKKQQKQKKNMHKHYAKHIEINSHFTLK